MATIKCCKDCTERELGCHGWCEKYIAAKNKLAEMRAAKEKERDIHAYTYNIVQTNRERSARSRQERRRWRLGGRTK